MTLCSITWRKIGNTRHQDIQDILTGSSQLILSVPPSFQGPSGTRQLVLFVVGDVEVGIAFSNPEISIHCARLLHTPLLITERLSLCLCILRVVYVFLEAAILTEVFPCFFLICKANARV